MLQLFVTRDRSYQWPYIKLDGVEQCPQCDQDTQRSQASCRPQFLEQATIQDWLGEHVDTHTHTRSTSVGSYLIFWMAARMDNTIHIQVEIVEFFAIGIGLCRINGNGVAIDDLGLFLNNLSNNLGELV